MVVREEIVSDAVVVWSGWGRFSHPRRDKKLLDDRFGSDAANELFAAVQRLEDEFYSSDARHVAKDLLEMGEIASQEFRKKHPEISADAIRALAWCYTFDHK